MTLTPTAPPAQALADLGLSRTVGRHAAIIAAAGCPTPIDQLEPWPGDYTTTKAGEVRTGYLFTGKVNVRHPNVLLGNSAILYGGTGRPGRLITAIGKPARGLVLDQVTVDGRGLVDEALFGGLGAYIDQVDMSGCADVLKPNSHSTVVSSYVHHLIRPAAARGAGIHADCWQATQGVDMTVKDSVFEAYNDVTGDYCNSAIQASSDTDPVGGLTGLTVTGCLFSGGNDTISVNGGIPARADGSGGTGPGSVGCSITDTQIIRGLYRYGPVNAGHSDRQQIELTWWQPPAETIPVRWAKP